MTATAAAAFTTTHRMVDRVHHNTADMGSETKIAFLSGLAEGDVHVIAISNRADGRFAREIDQADFPAGEFDLSIISILGTEQSHLSRGADQPGAFSGNHFHVETQQGQV